MNKDDLIQTALSSYLAHFEAPAQKASIAPARVNLIGEHTDYNDGFVLPAAIDFYTCVAGALNNDNAVNVVALDFNETDHFDLSAKDIQKSEALWKNFIRGAFYILKNQGYQLHGCNLVISGTIPKGAGLSSSASLEVALLATLNDLFQLNLSKLDMALIGQKIENEFVGLSCGIMDQLSVACGEKNRAILIDCQDYSIDTVKVPSELSIMIVNSNVKRELTQSGYNDRRRECEQAAQLLGISSLRDITIEEFTTSKSRLPDLISRRARHVISENKRVLDTIDALNKCDYAHLSALMRRSHISMRDDYEITVPEIDFLVDIIGDVLGSNGGVRMTGGGFGGCVVALVPSSLIEPVHTAIQDNYKFKTGITPAIYFCKPTAGVASFL